MLVAASPAFLRRHGSPKTPEDLKAMPAVGYTGSARPDIWRYRTADGHDGAVQLALRMRANNGSVLRDAAIRGVGVTMGPSFILHGALASGDLVPILTDVAWPDIAIHMVYPEQRHLSAKARAFIDYVKRRLGQEPAWNRLPGA